MATKPIIITTNPETNMVTLLDGYGEPITTTRQAYPRILGWLERWHHKRGRRTELHFITAKATREMNDEESEQLEKLIGQTKIPAPTSLLGSR